MLDKAQVPPRPPATAKPKAKKVRPFQFRIDFTDGAGARKFLDVVASAVTEMRIHVCCTISFTGIRLEAHDAYWHTAMKSQLECMVTAGTAADGTPLGEKDIHGTSFCVAADRFMTALDCALLKDTPLSLTRYVGGAVEEVTFEAITNEDDVHTAYAAPLIDNEDTKLGSLDKVAVELGFHVHISIDVFQKLTAIAKKCAAPTMRFDVFQAQDPKDPAILHSRMRVGFEQHGGHDFFLTARKGGAAGNEWEPMSGPSEAERALLPYAQKGSNEYDAAKLRLFVSKLSTDWVLLHLSNTNTTKPMVLECNMGGELTRHTIMIAPREGGKDGQ